MRFEYIYILLTILFTTYGQLIIKWRMSLKGQLPPLLKDKLLFLVSSLLDIYILSAFVTTFLAALCWMAAMTKFEVGQVFPVYTAVLSLLVVFSGVYFLDESLSVAKVLGVGLVAMGVILLSYKAA